jgi:octanoyl-[GcvH]:protein N-octanoyltransferase
MPDVTVPYRWLTVTRETHPDRLHLSPVLAEAVAMTAAAGQPAVLVREQHRYLLLGPQDRRLPTVAAAAEAAAAEGWPAFMRIGGGSAVLLDEGTLSFGAARPCRDLTTLVQNFHELAGGAVRALRRLGLPAQFGAAPGSYCEGPYDIVVDGQKVAGVAQAIRQGFTLVSGMLLVNQDPALVTERIQRLYRDAGAPKHLQSSAVTSLAVLMGRSPSRSELIDALRAGYSDAFRLFDDEVRPEEWARAERLLPARRFPSQVA